MPARRDSSIPARRVRLIERIVDAARALRPRAVRGIDVARLLRAYYHGLAEEDLAARDPRYLAAVALDHLRHARVRARGRALVRVFSPSAQQQGFDSPHSLVTVVTSDMPFLVDSLGIVFSQAGIGVHLIVHPVLGVQRDRAGRLRGIAGDGTDPGRAESWQLFEIDRQLEPARLEQLQRQIEATLADVQVAVADWPAMRAKAREIVQALRARGVAGALPAQRRAVADLLAWMADDHFTFLGYRHSRLRRGRRQDLLVPTRGSGLGILRAPRRGVPAPRPIGLSGTLRRRARDANLLIITKANSVATVHRASYLDYIGIKTFGPRGEVEGEHRFLGLWTSSVYQRSPREIPLLAQKVEQIVEHFGLDATSHDAKAVMHVLNTFPRDELFQASVPELVPMVRGIVNLYERDLVRLFVRRDAFERFYSCLVFVPRDRYSTDVRARIESLLQQALGSAPQASVAPQLASGAVPAGLPGGPLETQVQLSESTLARLHIIVRTDPLQHHRVDAPQLERAIAAAATTWADGLREALAQKMDEAAALACARRYASALPAAYTEDVEPAAALDDIEDLEALRAEPGHIRVGLYRPPRQRLERVHLKIVKLGDPVPISDILPMMENFGLRVIAERPYELAWPEGGSAWIQDFELEHREGARLDIERVAPLCREAFLAVWQGDIENDGFNRLLLAAGLSAREIVVLRAYCRYLLQTGIPFSQAYMERVLSGHAALARNLLRMFQLQLDPNLPAAARARAERLARGLLRSFDAIKGVDEDRILRSYFNVLRATLRTNFYQTDAAGNPKPYLALKLDPQRIPDLPLPRPRFEVFVYSPRVEAVHLRMAHVARGGIRWSDRREDFRTEVLGLMKAQNVKNTVIVPMGAKGGFVVKRPTSGAERQREGIACYQTFMRGLLDVTDNIRDGRIVPPAQLVRRDGDDPYLVVAADKGTASFSDIANAIAADYGFWLGDAFASGGSAGYDHKGMGITARGAWECVKRHFRELGTDIQRQDFTVAGIGDMSGDVFGNGMLLSRHILLKAAFNHQHIFLDPAPDARRSFTERARLFALPGSTWDDYDKRLISRGGGVHARAAKTLTLSSEAQAMLGLASASATPQEIIRQILRMPVDLLWNGGIGTYVRASTETDLQIGDRTNDAVRVTGAQLGAKVVGEGGNLGLSQRGRIEYALRGGRCNTDFIDNSAGVNTSDVEVNIKVALNPLVHSGKLRTPVRNRLLARMTDEVAALVLRNNYLQSQSLSTLEPHSATHLAEYQFVIRALERSGELDRAIEFLPEDEELLERRKRGSGLTRPELAVVLSYGKIWLSHHLLDSDVPEDPYLSHELERYFPSAMRRRFAGAIAAHRLRREIIVTATTNSLINRMGPAFVLRAEEETGADPARIARAYTAAREIFEMRRLWADIEALDNRIEAKLQYSMMYQTTRLLRHVTHWLLLQRGPALSIEGAVARLRGGVRELGEHIAGSLEGLWREHFEATRQRLTQQAVPHILASRIAALDPLNSALDIVELAASRRARIAETAHVYFRIGARIGLDWVRDQVEELPVEGTWQAAARSELRFGVYRAHRRLSERVLMRGRAAVGIARVNAWIAGAGKELGHFERMITEMRAAGAADFATLSVGLESLRKLVD